MNIGIVGYGYVGKHLNQTFSAPGMPPPQIYDKYLHEHNSEHHRERINDCDLVFVAVPTPSTPDGRCDVSAVEDVLQWVRPPVCIKSTVPPGTTDRLVNSYHKQVVFSPEYIGETRFHRYHQPRLPDLVVVGGAKQTRTAFMSLFREVFGPEPRYFEVSAVTAELSKYMENSFFATKVAFVSQYYLLAQHFGADFTEMREIWVADERVGRSHSTIIGQLGFGGRCLPKDLSAIVELASAEGADVSLLHAVQLFNKHLRNNAEDPSDNISPRGKDYAKRVETP